MELLCSERLVLRPFQPADEAAVLAFRNDPEVARYQGWALPYTADLFAQLVDSRRLEETGWMSRCITDGRDVLGDLGLRPHRPPDGSAELGISLARHAQGKGYAAEALARIVQHAFTDLGLDRVYASVDPRNSAVVRLLTRAGWEHEGTTEKTYLHRGVLEDDAIYAVRRADWTV